MTRRERLEAKIEKREQWAEGRDKRAAGAFKRFTTIADGIPLGQPILVGHHSERHHRRDIARMDSALRDSSESSKMADHHRSKAAGLEAQLDGSIFSDDPDAVDALKARIAELEAKRERMKSINAAHKAYLKKPAGLDMNVNLTEADKARIRNYQPAYSWEPHPFAPYQLSNLAGNIGRLRKRLVDVAARAVRQEKAEQAGMLIEGTGDYIRVTFPEKPAREVLTALREAGFRWGGGSWTGRRDALPEIVKQEAT